MRHIRTLCACCILLCEAGAASTSVELDAELVTRQRKAFANAARISRQLIESSEGGRYAETVRKLSQIKRRGNFEVKTESPVEVSIPFRNEDIALERFWEYPPFIKEQAEKYVSPAWDGILQDFIISGGYVQPAETESKLSPFSLLELVLKYSFEISGPSVILYGVVRSFIILDATGDGSALIEVGTICSKLHKEMDRSSNLLRELLGTEGNLALIKGETNKDHKTADQQGEEETKKDGSSPLTVEEAKNRLKESFTKTVLPLLDELSIRFWVLYHLKAKGTDQPRETDASELLALYNNIYLLRNIARLTSHLLEAITFREVEVESGTGEGIFSHSVSKEAFDAFKADIDQAGAAHEAFGSLYESHKEALKKIETPPVKIPLEKLCECLGNAILLFLFEIDDSTGLAERSIIEDSKLTELRDVFSKTKTLLERIQTDETAENSILSYSPRDVELDEVKKAHSLLIKLSLYERLNTTLELATIVLLMGCGILLIRYAHLPLKMH